MSRSADRARQIAATTALARRAATALSAVAIALIGSLSGAPLSAAATPQASLPEIEYEVMCPICGTALGLSESPQANDERQFIRRMIARGLSKDEIKARLVATYGPSVLAIPEDDPGFDILGYAMPAVGFAIALLVLALGLRRYRSDPQPAPDPREDLGEADAARLETDLQRYRL